MSKGAERALTAAATLAGLLYNSWLLGYWLNPAVAKSGLASEFEALRQPYDWLFIGCDVICGLLVLLVCWGLRKQAAAAVLAGLMVFAVGTIVDTLLPMHCLPSLQRCPSFTQDHLLLWHGVASIGAALGLFSSLLLLWWHDRRSRLLIVLMAAYVLFGLFSLFDAVQTVHHNWSQHYYLVLCGVWLALVPMAIRKSPRPSAPPAKSRPGA
ncbi:MAG TPA: DUF998 domain-containing protein [Verrucomicrobiae bacterium]|nr:DUF998 domain-containing protein [Verrucomicrobiae bacterium]